jgi:hypothetical protein
VRTTRLLLPHETSGLPPRTDDVRHRRTAPLTTSAVGAPRDAPTTAAAQPRQAHVCRRHAAPRRRTWNSSKALAKWAMPESGQASRWRRASVERRLARCPALRLPTSAPPTPMSARRKPMSGRRCTLIASETAMSHAASVNVHAWTVTARRWTGNGPDCAANRAARTTRRPGGSATVVRSISRARPSGRRRIGSSARLCRSGRPRSAPSPRTSRRKRPLHRDLQAILGAPLTRERPSGARATATTRFERVEEVGAGAAGSRASDSAFRSSVARARWPTSGFG